MHYIDSDYHNTDEQFEAIRSFLDELSHRDPHMLWESGRMNYWRHTVHAQETPSSAFWKSNVHTWHRSSGEIIALFISEYGMSDFFIEVDPDTADVYPLVFAWIRRCWVQNRSTIDIDLYSDDVKRIEVLKHNGFTFDRHFENKRLYEPDQLDLDYTLPDGFSIQPFSELQDIMGRVDLVQDAFDNPKYSVENLEGLLSSPDYVDSYNLAVVAPDGTQAAYCVGWLNNAADGAGYIEPVGTRKAYRKRGFAKAVIKECFARMKEDGVRSVEISSRAEPNISNFLYDSLEPAQKREVHKYAKSF